MTSRVALVMAPLLPRIRMGVGNNGLENGGGLKGDLKDYLRSNPTIIEQDILQRNFCYKIIDN